MIRRTVFAFALPCLFGLCGISCSSGDTKTAAEQVPVSITPDEIDMVNVETVPLSSIEAVKPLVALRSPNYRIKDQVRIVMPYYVFEIECPHGDYAVKSIRQLIKTCHEIDVIETFRRTKHGPQMLTGAMDYVMDFGTSAKLIVFHPGAAAKAIVRMPARLGRELWGYLTYPMRKMQEDEDSKIRTRGAKGIFYSKDIRAVAHELGVDCYTDNVNMQALLHSIARQRKLGKLALKYYMPAVEGLKYIQYASTGGAHNVGKEQLIAENNSTELQRINARLYNDQMGIDADKEELLQKLLDNFNYSPREETDIRIFLARIGRIKGLASAFRFLADADNPEQAIHNAAQLDLMTVLHDYDSPLRHYVSLGNNLGAINQRNELMVIVPYDIVKVNPLTRLLVERAFAVAKKARVRGVQIWFTGEVSWDFYNLAKRYKFTVRRNVLDDPIFTLPPKSSQQKSPPAN